MRARPWIIAAALLTAAGLFAAPKPAAPDSFVSGTSLAIPMKAGAKVQWVVPPADRSKAAQAKWENVRFQVDEKGRPWYAHDGRVLVNPVRGVRFTLSEPIEDFAALPNGAILLASKTNLGFLGEPSRLELKNGLPVFPFQPALVLPGTNVRLFPGDRNVLYFAVANPKSGEDELYLLQPRGPGRSGYRKLYAGKERVTAAAGDGARSFVALGRVVVELLDGGKVRGLYRSKQAAITDLAYSSRSGLFYATAADVGFVGKTKSFSFIRTPRARIRIRNNVLYVMFADMQGVVKIEGLHLFK